MSELVTTLDDNMCVIGQQTRAQVHQTGAWHEVFHLWIVIVGEDGNHHLALQKRSEKKSQFPLAYDVSAAGHLAAGETKENGFREVREELGVSISEADCYYLGVRPDVYCSRDFINREFSHVYVYLADFSLIDRIVLGEEVSDITFIPFKSFYNFAFARSSKYMQLKEDELYKYIGLGKLVPRNAGYYQSIAANIGRILAGQTEHLAV